MPRVPMAGEGLLRAELENSIHGKFALLLNFAENLKLFQT